MHRFSRILVAIAIQVGLTVPAHPATTPTGTALDSFLSGVTRTVLPNGLTLLVAPEPGSGVVAINTWVKAGYFHEPDEVAGMAHLFEHMFFKGSAKFPGAEQIAQELGRVGGQTNAGTIYDSTNYYFVVPAESFQRGVEIQADAIMNPLFDPAELKKEAEVVIEESNRKLDNPSPVSIERMFAVAFTDHRIKRWRIGSNEVLRSIDRDDLLDFFQTLYRPENIILSIAGDVTPERALQVASETFGKLPKGALAKRGGPAEPEQKEFRFGQSAADLQAGYTVLGWHTTGVGTADELAVDVLSIILGGGKSSRLYRNVLAPEAASTVTAQHWAFEDVGMLLVQASFDEKNRQEVDRRILQEIERIKKHGPTPYELQLAKNANESGFILGLQTALGQAQALSYAEANYGYREIGARLARLAQLTPEQIRDVARKYLRTENLTLYHYQPTGAPSITRDEALAGVLAATGGSPLTAEEGVALPKSAAPVRAASAAGAPRETKLSNGATLIIRERPGAPVVSAGVYFRGGRTGEHTSNAGITELMTRAMRRGTTSRSADQINREIEFLGTQIGATTPSDYFGFTLTIPAKNFRPALDILSDVVLNPTFPEKDVNEEKHLQSGAVKRSFDSATQRPFQLLERAYYGNHPYALPSSGYLSSIEAIDRAALTEWWRKWVVADDALIVIVGDIDAAEGQRLAEASFGSLKKRAGGVAKTPASEPPITRTETVEYRKRKQSAIAVAYPGVPMSHPDWPRLRLLQNVVSGLGGTFFGELRGKRSLAYTVFAGDDGNRDARVFYGYLASDTAKEEEAKKALIAEFKRLGEDGMAEADVERAKAYFAGSTRISRQTNAAHVGQLSQAWMFGLGLDFTDRLLQIVPSITLENLKEAARKYLAGDGYTMAVVSGDAD